MQARLSFSSSPIPIVAVGTNGQILNLAANVARSEGQIKQLTAAMEFLRWEIMI